MKACYRPFLQIRIVSPIAIAIAVPLAVFCFIITSPERLYGEGRPIGEVARGLAESHGDAIVTISVVMKMTLTVTGNPDQTQEQAAEVSGTIVNSKGWVATSYSNIQPQVNAERLPDGIEANITTDIKEIKILWADGEDSTAEVVLHDSDLDVSILRPLEARESTVFVDFLGSADRPEPQVLDEIVLLGRQEKSLDRLIRVETGRLNALIKHPRPIFVASVAAPGSPVFDRSGELLGFSALKRSEGQVPAPVIRPISDVSSVLQAALAGSDGVAEQSGESAAEAADSTLGLTETGRAILEKFQESVVSLVAIAESGGRTREVRSIGTVIGADGLVVTSRSGVGADLKEVKIILADGSEVPATVVLDDPDLDLAFVRAKQEEVAAQGLQFAPVPLANEEGAKQVELQIADPVIILTREAPAFFRQAKLMVTYVDSLVDLPRRYYRTPEKEEGALAFNKSGEPVGVYARRVSGEETRHRMILPLSHIADGADRARKAIADSDSAGDDESTNTEQEEAK